MARVQKQYNRLDTLESEIRARLVRSLRAAVEGKKTTFFIVAAYNPFGLNGVNSSETEALLALADEAKALREKLGEPIATAVGERLRDYCRRAEDLSHPNRLGPHRLAEQFLAELGEQASPRQ